MALDEREKRNIERVKHWSWTWNNAVDRMVDECYAEDCEVVNMMTGYTMHGREELTRNRTRDAAVRRHASNGDHEHRRERRRRCRAGRRVVGRGTQQGVRVPDV